MCHAVPDMLRISKSCSYSHFIIGSLDRGLPLAEGSLRDLITMLQPDSYRQYQNCMLMHAVKIVHQLKQIQGLLDPKHNLGGVGTAGTDDGLQNAGALINITTRQCVPGD